MFQTIWPAKMLAAAAMLIFMAPATEAQAGQALSFFRARDILYERSDALKASAENVESRKQAASSLAWLHGPQISVQATELWGETRIDVDKSISTPAGAMPVHLEENYNFSGPRASISGVLPIFTGGKIGAVQKASEYAAEEAQARLKEVRVGLDTDLIGKYFGLQLAVSMQNLRKDMLDEQNRELDRAIKFEREGMISNVECLGVRVARDAAEREYLKARDARKTAFLQLQRLLRDETFNSLSTPLFVVKSPLKSMRHWVDTALANNPQLFAAESRTQQAREGVKGAQSTWSPQVFAFGQYSFIRHYQTAIEPTWLAGLGVNLTLWDSRDRLANFKSARATLREAQAAHAEARNLVKTETETAWLNTQNAREQYTLTASTVKMAQENLRLKSRAFGEGLATSLDVTEARNQLVAAEEERRIAAYNFIVNYAILHAISGKMDEFMLAYKKQDVIVEK